MSRPELAIVDAEVDGVRCDVVVAGGVVTSVERAGARPEAGLVIDARGGALIPGLHDHHVHLTATAAARTSVDVGPGVVCGLDGLAGALRAGASALPPGRWLRAVGYHESVAGPLDRDVLDRLAGDRPVRIQHRSGAAWFVSSAGLAELGIADAPGPGEPAGVERDPSGRPTGRLFRVDEWLRARVPSVVPDLVGLGQELAALGVTGCTDATPWPSVEALAAFAAATHELPQRLLTMTAPGVTATGPVKVVLGDHDLPALDDIERWFEGAHAAGRPVAVHSVTAESLALALAAWEAVGSVDGDRVEHAAVVAEPAVAVLATLGVRVVTQPGMVAARGETYLDDIDPAHHDELWRCRTLLDAGVRVAAGTDSPYGLLDPWAAIAAAVRRRTPSGRVLGPHERVDVHTALALHLSALDDPGGVARRVHAGAPADVCLLDAPLDEVLAEPSAGHVRATVIAGHIVHGAPGTFCSDRG
jgi:predicted amidohydrolase YtcJ